MVRSRYCYGHGFCQRPHKQGGNFESEGHDGLCEQVYDDAVRTECAIDMQHLDHCGYDVCRII
jgi:hypothetical protein